MVENFQPKFGPGASLVLSRIAVLSAELPAILQKNGESEKSGDTVVTQKESSVNR